MSLSAAAFGVMQTFCNTLINLIGLVTFLIVEATGIISIKLLMIDYDCTGSVSIYMVTVYSALLFVSYGEDTMDFILDQFIGTEDYDAFINNTTHYSSEHSSVDVTPSSTLPVAAHDDLTPAAPTVDCCCPLSLIMSSLSCDLSSSPVGSVLYDENKDEYCSQSSRPLVNDDSSVVITNDDDGDPIDVPLPPDSDDDDEEGGDLSPSVAAPVIKVHPRNNPSSARSRTLKTNNTKRNKTSSDVDSYYIPKRYLKFKLDFASINKQFEQTLANGEKFICLGSITSKV